MKTQFADRGFTLADLLVAVAIVGILASVAYPSYASYVTRSRRAEGKLALLDILQQQERHYSQHNTYVAFSADTDDTDPRRFKWWSGPTSQGSAYELRGQACEGSDIGECIEITALPGTERVDAQFRDSECGTLRADSIGRRSASGSSTRCWP
ncbi:type IV pilin protein [Massilia cavernae]|uniref:Type IV pilin protein n=1 Tax=Massilia cavernae TaxID=2320864 RepID=A0A418XV98_9BURK|nr:type IV pilin protein [Massilia cavernae]RJG16625.1 type IV pilin protein [Massilia cavernae]